MVFPLLKKVCIRRRERKKRGKKEKKELKKKKEKQKMTLMEKKYLKKKKIYCGRGENPITNCEEGPALGSRGGPGSGAGATYSLWGFAMDTSQLCKLLPVSLLPFILFGPAQG